MKNTIALTLHVKNVSPDSIEMAHGKSCVEVKFISIGAGHFPSHYAFYFAIPSEAGTIADARADPWDNNLIIQLDFKPLKSFSNYQAGLSKQDYQDFPCPFTEKAARAAKDTSPSPLPAVAEHPATEEIAIEVTSASPEEIQIDISSSGPFAAQHTNKSKKHKKSKKKRSYSESHCDQLLADIEEEHAATQQAAKAATSTINPDICVHQKSRSISESSNDDQHACEPVLKSILKRRSSYNRSLSDCSIDEQATGKYSCSMDLGIGSFSSIPEERGELSESVRKTVTFDKNLCRKLLFK